jgi:hypothetical protein
MGNRWLCSALLLSLLCLGIVAPPASTAAEWVTQPIGLATPQKNMELAFDPVSGAPVLLTYIAGTTRSATRNGPWNWTAHDSQRSQLGLAPAQDNLGNVHAVSQDDAGNGTVMRSTLTPWQLEAIPNLSNPDIIAYPRLAVEPSNQLERVLSLHGEQGSPLRFSLHMYLKQPTNAWQDVSVDPSATISYESRFRIIIDNSNDTWLAATYHFLSPPTPILKAYHVDPITGTFDGHDIAIVDIVDAIEMRFAHGSFGPIIGLTYGGIQPTPGQVALFYRDAIVPTGWNFADVDSNAVGGQMDVAMSSGGVQYVAYVKYDPARQSNMVCLASRALPEVGTRPFAVDTLIRAGHLGNDQPARVAMFLDEHEDPVVLSLVAASGDPGSVDRIYESVVLTPTTGIRMLGDAARNLTVTPSPARVGIVINVSSREAFDELRVYDLLGRIVLSQRLGVRSRGAQIATERLSRPGLYFVVAIAGGAPAGWGRLVTTR